MQANRRVVTRKIESGPDWVGRFFLGEATARRAGLPQVLLPGQMITPALEPNEGSWRVVRWQEPIQLPSHKIRHFSEMAETRTIAISQRPVRDKTWSYPCPDGAYAAWHRPRTSPETKAPVGARSLTSKGLLHHARAKALSCCLNGSEPFLSHNAAVVATCPNSQPVLCCAHNAAANG